METKKCPMCAEEVLVDAVKCKHCGSMLDGSEATSSQVQVDPKVASGKALVCQHCSGEMKKKSKANHSQFMALLLLLFGLIASLTGVGLVIGIPMILIGLYMGVATKKIWMCKNCGSVIERA